MSSSSSRSACAIKSAGRPFNMVDLILQLQRLRERKRRPAKPYPAALSYPRARQPHLACRSQLGSAPLTPQSLDPTPPPILRCPFCAHTSPAFSCFVLRFTFSDSRITNHCFSQSQFTDYDSLALVYRTLGAIYNSIISYSREKWVLRTLANF